jgi:hypothetical protein
MVGLKENGTWFLRDCRGGITCYTEVSTRANSLYILARDSVFSLAIMATSPEFSIFELTLRKDTSMIAPTCDDIRHSSITRIILASVHGAR